jgi:hypothetical protein
MFSIYCAGDYLTRSQLMLGTGREIDAVSPIKARLPLLIAISAKQAPLYRAMDENWSFCIPSRLRLRFWRMASVFPCPSFHITL